MTDNSLLQDFIIETGEHLEDTERNLLRLEQQPDDADLLNEIFRSIHTIKGSSEYLGLESIAELSHKLESLLDLLRRKERVLDSNVIELLISTNDRIGALVKDLSQIGEEKASIDDLVTRIEVFSGHVTPVSAEEAVTETISPDDGDVIQDELDDELFGIFLDQLKDGLEALHEQTQNALNGNGDETLLTRYENRLDSLRSSANYMGYENLKQVYSQWVQSLAVTRKQLTSGGTVDWPAFAETVTGGFTERVKSFFPKVEEVQQIETTFQIPEDFSLDLTESVDAPEEEEQELLFDDIDMGNEEELQPGIDEHQMFDETSPELDLFSDSDELTPALEEPVDNSLLDEFIVETGEHLEEAERNLLQFEQQPANEELLNDIFRSMHTIKGSSEYLGLERVAEISHKVENMLDLLRRGERDVNPAVIDLLINANDRIGQLVDDLSKSREEKTSIDDLVIRIDEFSGQVPPVSPEEVTEPSAPQEVIDEIDDEYDQELFGIFVEQLQDGLDALAVETRKLLDGDTGQTPLAIYEDRLGTLRASANYMGYDSLRLVYEEWLQLVGQTVSQVGDGGTADWAQFTRDVTMVYMQRVAAFFPKIEAVQQIFVEIQLGDEQAADETPEEIMQADEPQTGEQAINEIEEASTEEAATEEVLTEDETDDMFQEPDQGLLADFIAETGEHLEEIEHNLLTIKDAPEDENILNDLFRSVHTIKGSSEYLGMQRISELSHRLEGLLDLLRRKELVVNTDVIDLLIDGRDRIAKLVDDLTTYTTEKTGIDDLIERIHTIVEAPQEEVVPDESVMAATESEPEQVATETKRDFDEIYDKELFDIYMEQFQTGISTLKKASETIASGQETEATLDDCKQHLLRLRSSANYMEYDELKKLFERWIDEIDGLVGQISDNQTVDLSQWAQEIMAGHIEKALQYFDAPVSDDEGRATIAPIEETEELPESEGITVDEPDEAGMVSQTDEPPGQIDETTEQLEPIAAPPEEDEDAGLIDTPVEAGQPSEIEEIAAESADAGEYVDGQTEDDIFEQYAMEDETPAPDEALMPVEDTATFNIDKLLEMPIGDMADLTMSFDDESPDDESLLSRLESAFDENIGVATTMHDQEEDQIDLVKELLSGEEDMPAPPFLGESQSTTPVYSAASGKEIESLLFSDSSGETAPRQTILPKPLARPTKKVFQRATSALDEEERRGQFQLGRRQSDKFRDRLIKQSIRVDAAKIDTLMNQVGELVVTRAGFSQLFLEMRELQLKLKQSQRLDTKEMIMVKELTSRINETTVTLGRVTSELQENVMKVRMLPIAQLFSRYPRVVHDLVRNTDKQVELTIHGEETELDRMVIEQISDPLVHIIRNAVDHGIEEKEERQRSGKPETGTVRLEAYHEGNYVVIEIGDDGRGIDMELIKSKALSKGFAEADELEAMREDELLTIIMLPGFSTAEEVTHTSGRGVGMDVVKDNIEKLNGTIDIESTPGRGTLFRIKIPLTLAIIQALLVRVTSELFVIPLSAVDETIRIHANEISTIEGMEVYYLRETTLPLIRLSRIFKMAESDPTLQELFVVVVNTGNRQVGLIVDQLRGREEVVIKPLEDYLQEKSGFSGATILGDGSISLILDVADVVNLAIDQHMRRLRRTATV